MFGSVWSVDFRADLVVTGMGYWMALQGRPGPPDTWLADPNLNRATIVVWEWISILSHTLLAVCLLDMLLLCLD